MWGIIPAAGLGSRIQPLAFSKELLPVGSRLDGEAERPRAVSEYLVERMRLAGDIVRTMADGPISLAAVRRLYWESPHNTFEEQIDQERMAQQRAGRTEDFVEGVTAFLQKRPAQFKGR